MSAATPPGGHGSYLMPSLEHATVADAMHPGVLTCDPEAGVTDVARMMATHHIHCIAVMGVADEHGESLGWGIISDLELIRAGVEATERLAAGMARPIVSVEPATPLLDAARLMLSHSSPHLLVLDSRKQRPVGVVSTLDIAGVLAWGEA